MGARPGDQSHRGRQVRLHPPRRRQGRCSASERAEGHRLQPQTSHGHREERLVRQWRSERYSLEHRDPREQDLRSLPDGDHRHLWGSGHQADPPAGQHADLLDPQHPEVLDRNHQPGVPPQSGFLDHPVGQHRPRREQGRAEGHRRQQGQELPGGPDLRAQHDREDRHQDHQRITVHQHRDRGWRKAHVHRREERLGWWYWFW